jgi:hypothetical protein
MDYVIEKEEHFSLPVKTPVMRSKPAFSPHQHLRFIQ